MLNIHKMNLSSKLTCKHTFYFKRSCFTFTIGKKNFGFCTDWFRFMLTYLRKNSKKPNLNWFIYKKYTAIHSLNVPNCPLSRTARILLPNTSLKPILAWDEGCSISFYSLCEVDKKMQFEAWQPKLVPRNLYNYQRSNFAKNDVNRPILSRSRVEFSVLNLDHSIDFYIKGHQSLRQFTARVHCPES